MAITSSSYKLAHAIGPVVAQAALICDAVHQSEAGPLDQKDRQRCAERTIRLLGEGKDPQVVTDIVANEMGKPPWILIGVLGAAALVGGAWLWSRRR
jgi:hypothetical protein